MGREIAGTDLVLLRREARTLARTAIPLVDRLRINDPTKEDAEACLNFVTALFHMVNHIERITEPE